MDLQTPVEVQKSNVDISHKNQLLMIGSCFAENIGDILLQQKFNLLLNPFGILYNPSSISQALNILLEKIKFTDKDVFEHKGIYHSFFHHSIFSSPEKEKCLNGINQELEAACSKLQNTDVIIITFGTAYAYRHKEKDLIVSNCHKLPANCFDRYRLSIDSIVDDWGQLIQKLQANNPASHLIFTVSPIRHFKDGAHDNQLSKSILLLAIEELCRTYNKVHYFPSYEILLDELRDYRFYNEDMIHPNNVAIKYIYEKFSGCYFNEETNQIIAQWTKLNAALQHRPFNEQSTEHKRFVEQTILNLKAFNAKYPHINCEKEQLILANKLL